MAIDTTDYTLAFLNVIANVGIAVNIKAFGPDTVSVTYCDAAITAGSGVDYILALDPDTFLITVTPLQPMIDKINAQILLDPTDINIMTVTRELPLTSDLDATDAFFRQKIADNFDKFMMVIQQVLGGAEAATKLINDAIQASATVELFQSLYLGAQGVFPATDNDGKPLIAGAWFYYTVNNLTYIYSGTAWQLLSAYMRTYTTVALIRAADPSGLIEGDLIYLRTSNAIGDFYQHTLINPGADDGAKILLSATAGHWYTRQSSSQYVPATTTQLVFAGATMFQLSTVVPAGWLECNGQVVSRTSFPALFSHANTSGNIVSDATWLAGTNHSTDGKFSTGDGSTTFRIPQLQGMFPRGWDNGRGVDTGRTIGSGQLDQFQDHGHAVSAPVAATGISPGAAPNAAALVTATSTGNSNSGRAGTETRPLNVAGMFLIKAH